MINIWSKKVNPLLDLTAWRVALYENIGVLENQPAISEYESLFRARVNELCLRFELEQLEFLKLFRQRWQKIGGSGMALLEIMEQEYAESR